MKPYKIVGRTFRSDSRRSRDLRPRVGPKGPPYMFTNLRVIKK